MAFFIAPNPVWLFRGLNGKPLAEGRVEFFRDIARDEPKDVFQDPGGVIPYPTPIVLSPTGTVPTLIYFNDDELYYIEIFNLAGDKIYEIEAFPNTGSGGGGPPGDIIFNIENLYANPQFRFFTDNPLADLPADILRVAYLWDFQKNNTTATDSIQFIPFNLGVNDPIGTPTFYLRYETTSPGNNEAIKDLFQTWPDVRTFESTEVSLALESRRVQGGGDISILIEQNFGTGGAPSPPVFTNVITFPLTAGWDKYQTTFIFPSVGGSSLGTNGDDFIRIRIRFPLNTTTTIDLTNGQFHIGDSVPEFPRVPYILDKGKTASAILPLAEGSQDIGKNITVAEDLTFTLQSSDLAGAIFPFAYNIPVSAPPPLRFYFCDGQTYPSSGDQALFEKIVHYWGFGVDAFLVEDFGDGSILINHSIGQSVTTITMGAIDPGFTVTSYQSGNPINARFISTTINSPDSPSPIENQFTITATEKGFIATYDNTGMGLDSTGTYEQQYTTPSGVVSSFFRGNEQMPFTANPSPQLQPITPGDYFEISNPADDEFAYYYTVDAVGVPPALPGVTDIPIPVLSTDNDIIVKLKTVAVMGGQESEILTFTDGSTIPGGSYYNLNTFSGPLFYIWFRNNGIGIDPDIPGRIGVPIDILAADTEEQIAEKNLAALRDIFFQVPDLRGQFLRGFDPDFTLDASGTRGLGAENIVGSTQYPENLSHSHVILTGGETQNNNFVTQNATIVGRQTDTNATGTSESRPINKAVSYLIQRF